MTDRDAVTRPRDAGSGRHTAASVLACLFTAACFFPYPSLPVGGSTGLQANQVIAVAALPILALVGLPPRHLLAFGLLTGALVLSGYLVLLGGRARAPEILIKEIAITAVALVVLVPAGAVATRRAFPGILAGAALAITVHAVAGFYQAYAFSQERFPFLWIYTNPSFASLEQVADVYALYVRRPFGLFPEPSAMTASIGPWLVLFTGVLLCAAPRRGVTGKLRALLVVATVTGTLLVVLSRSGYAVALLACMLALPLLAMAREHRAARSPVARGVVPLMVIAVVAIGAVVAREAVGTREPFAENASWQARSQSLVIGIAARGRTTQEAIVGLGPGQTVPFLERATTSELLPAWYRPATVEPVIAIWSVVVRYAMETGLLGAGALVGLVGLVLRAVRRSAARLVGFTAFAAWIVGVILATSYYPLSAIWLFLALLLAWDRVFGADGGAIGEGEVPPWLSPRGTAAPG